jgi:uncharacterized protein (DUF111 family)
MLILAQVDDRSGEELGDALTRLPELGARNVQLLSSLTKKGRPGYVLLVDLEPEAETEVAAFLAAELGVWGYHLVPAEHRHFLVEAQERRVEVTCGRQRQSFGVRCKLFYQGDRLIRVKADQADTEEICAFVKSAGRDCPSALVRAGIEKEVWKAPSARNLFLEF